MSTKILRLLAEPLKQPMTMSDSRLSVMQESLTVTSSHHKDICLRNLNLLSPLTATPRLPSKKFVVLRILLEATKIGTEPASNRKPIQMAWRLVRSRT